MKLARFTTIVGVAIALGASCLAAYNHIASGEVTRAADDIFTAAVNDLQSSRDLTHAVDNIKVDIIQVQQWLTDISATRGQDGLNDGFDLAAEYAEKFPVDLAEARRLSAGLADGGIATTLDQVEAAFPGFYAAGKAMAEKYVADGPSGGNAMMGDFDAAAATLGESVDLMEAAADRYAGQVAQGAETMRSALAADQLEHAIMQLITFAVLVLAMAIMTGFFAGYALRRIRSMSRQMTAIAQGDYTMEMYGSSVWEELKEIAAAAEIFRENGLRLEELQADEAVQAQARREERRQMMANLQAAFGRVVEATISGDFSARVPTTFADPELNELASKVNNLVATVGAGLGETGEVLNALGNLDLTMRMSDDQVGAFEGLRDDANRVADTLTKVVGDLRRTSGSLRTATSEILAGANDLSDRTTRQAATIEQTSAAMDHLASTMSQNATVAAAASEQSTTVSQMAQASEAEMASATRAMAEITTASSKLQNFIGVIDDIAFQTNLLALNASVEAARAGDAGKGFAVVAIEVRRLAQSAASASHDAQDLVEKTVALVRNGDQIISGVAGKLSDVIREVMQATESMNRVASDSRAQSGSVREVTVAIQQMDEMTQHNAALVEETNAAIEQTEAQAKVLDDLIGAFQLTNRRTAMAA